VMSGFPSNIVSFFRRSIHYESIKMYQSIVKPGISSSTYSTQNGLKATRGQTSWDEIISVLSADQSGDRTHDSSFRMHEYGRGIRANLSRGFLRNVN
jgi:hypothetical protein